jgi:hypothetical protein
MPNPVGTNKIQTEAQLRRLFYDDFGLCGVAGFYYPATEELIFVGYVDIIVLNSCVHSGHIPYTSLPINWEANKICFTGIYTTFEAAKKALDLYVPV